MERSEELSLEQIRAFLEGSEEVSFQAQNRQEVYSWVNWILRQQNYGELKRSGKGLVRRYLAKMTGLSRAQVTRLIGIPLRCIGSPVTTPITTELVGRTESPHFENVPACYSPVTDLQPRHFSSSS
jgi:hypothetical protein